MRLRAWLGGFLALVLFVSLGAVPSVSVAQPGAGMQVNANVTVKAGYRTLAITGKWVNTSDYSQDGSKSNPFTPGSQLRLRIDVSGFDLPRLLFIPGGIPSLGGAARGISTGASYNWHLNSVAWDKAWAQGIAHISIPQYTGNGGVATWSLNKAEIQLTDSGLGAPRSGSSSNIVTTTEKYQIPALSGTFHIAASPKLEVENVSVTASAVATGLTSTCTGLPSRINATHQVQLNLTASNGSNVDLHGLTVEWENQNFGSSPGTSINGALVVEQGVIFGHVLSETSKKGTAPAVTYCAVIADGGQEKVQLSLADATIQGHAYINGVKHGPYSERLGSLSASVDVTAPAPQPTPSSTPTATPVPTPAATPEPESVPVPEPEGTLPLGETETGDAIDETDSGDETEVEAPQSALVQATLRLQTANEKLVQEQDGLAAQYQVFQQAGRANRVAHKELRKAKADYKAAVKRAERLAARAVGGGDKAQQRADQASAAAAEAAEKVATLQAKADQTKTERDEAQRILTNAYAAVQAAQAEADAAGEALKQAIAEDSISLGGVDG